MAMKAYRLFALLAAAFSLSVSAQVGVKSGRASADTADQTAAPVAATTVKSSKSNSDNRQQTPSPATSTSGATQTTTSDKKEKGPNAINVKLAREAAPKTGEDAGAGKPNTANVGQAATPAAVTTVKSSKSNSSE
jgi:hypothetical protein